ncbi:hypothetical protein NUW58_g6473 [Xylaria curta]|uniref:Uncharacterized protein n=1 Tax=Xylaria curta TaxID=42375 RepID=A0ACC1NSI6_9PEZI|nr:hypothetical protein NUW58_g6473 [Xylaria curta]
MLERQALKRAALYTQPKLLPSRPWLVFVVERVEGKVEGQSVINMMASVAKEFKALSSGEIERLGSIAEKNKLANAAAYKAWVESHSPLDTYNANKARKSLKKKFNFPVGPLKTIRDERLPKKPSTPYALFTKARWASGDYTANGPITEHAQSISREWKSLTTAERQPYEDLARSSTESYNKAIEALIGRE